MGCMLNLENLKTRWLKARIAYHRRQAETYSRPVVRSYRRDGYTTWLRNLALRHAMKASALERKLVIAGGRI